MGYHHSISIRISSAVAANTLRSIQTFSCPQNSQRQPHDHCKHIRSMDQEQRNQTASSEVPERLRVENRAHQWAEHGTALSPADQHTDLTWKAQHEKT